MKLRILAVLTENMIMTNKVNYFQLFTISFLTFDYKYWIFAQIG